MVQQFENPSKPLVFWLVTMGALERIDLPKCPLPNMSRKGVVQWQVDYLLNSQEFTHMIMLDADAALVRHQVSESGGDLRGRFSEHMF